MTVLAISLSCVVYHFHWIYPYTRLIKPEVESAKIDSEQSSISLLTANVLMTNRNSAKLIEIVRNENPDILLTLETDQWWEERLSCLEEHYPFTAKCPLDNLYGMHLYSKLALHECEIKFLVEDGVPSIHTQIELPNGERIRTHFLHPCPPVPEYSDSSSARDAELIVVAKSLQNCDAPIIVAGDLNDVAWSETTRLFRKISGLLDPRVGRGMYSTFHADYWFLRWPLDHLFHSRHFQLGAIRRLDKFGSDHFALLVELAISSTANIEDAGLSATPHDEEFADEKIEQHDVATKDVPLDATAH